MSFINDYMLKRLADAYIQERLKEAEAGRLERQARAGRQGWFFRQKCRALYHFGVRLVALGRRLERFGTTPEVFDGLPEWKQATKI